MLLPLSQYKTSVSVLVLQLLLAIADECTNRAVSDIINSCSNSSGYAVPVGVVRPRSVSPECGAWRLPPSDRRRQRGATTTHPVARSPTTAAAAAVAVLTVVPPAGPSPNELATHVRRPRAPEMVAIDGPPEPGVRSDRRYAAVDLACRRSGP